MVWAGVSGRIETIIGPGDSGGAALRQTGNGWELVGINTFTEGYGGRCGDTGGGVLVGPYFDWISQMTAVPEPSGFLMVSFSALLLMRRRRGESVFVCSPASQGVLLPHGIRVNGR